MQLVILDAATFGETSLEGFNAFGEVTIHQTTSPDDAASRIANADVIITNKVVIDDALMAQSPHLRLICVAATGMNNIDLTAADKRNILVKNVAGYSTDSVVQHTFSMLFYLLGHSRSYDDYVKEGGWQRSPIFTHLTPPYAEVAGKQWGIIGLGTIGRRVAEVATAFGAKVSYFSTSGANDDAIYPRVSLETLLHTCDIVSIHAPLNNATRNLIDRDALAQLKPGAILMNLGRGGIINETALAEALDSQDLYAALDVLEHEPMSDPHPLMQIANKERLYVTPHIAWASIEARERLVAKILDNIQAFTDAQ
jgi:lactate dehydrogenase-like 2-hydroxyacid dehydrogenase